VSAQAGNERLSGAGQERLKLPGGALNVGGGKNPGTPGAAGATAAVGCSGGLTGATAGVMGRVAARGGAAATVGPTGGAATVSVIGRVAVIDRVLVLEAVRVSVGVSGDWKTGRPRHRRASSRLR